MALIEAILWALKVLGGAIVIGVALGIIILTLIVVREAAWVIRTENRRKHEKKEQEEKRE